METIINLQQLAGHVEKMEDERTARNSIVDKRFEDIEDILKNQPTKQDLDNALSSIANQEDVARLNNYVHNFTIAVSVLEKSGKWTVYTIVLLGGIAAGILAIKAFVVSLLAWLGFVHIK